MPTLTIEQADGQPLEDAVEQDIRKFEEWFKAKGNDPLVKSEIAILKTYCYYKTKGAEDGTQAGG